MPRAPRYDHDGGLYHVLARGNRKQPIFLDAHDAADFLRRLENLHGATDMEVHAFALMPNHVHLVLRRRHHTLCRFMHTLLAGFAQGFNRRHDTVGHLFQGRYKSILVHDQSYLLRLVRYVHRNPMAAGLCMGLDHPWTSYRDYLAVDGSWLDVEPVLQCFSRDLDEAKEMFVHYHRRETEQRDLDEIDGLSPVLGDAAFREQARRRSGLSQPADGTERPSLSAILWQTIEQHELAVEPIEVRGPVRHRAAARARALFLVAAVDRHGHSFEEVAGYLCRPASTLRALACRARARVRPGTECSDRFPRDPFVNPY